MNAIASVSLVMPASYRRSPPALAVRRVGELVRRVAARAAGQRLRGLRIARFARLLLAVRRLEHLPVLDVPADAAVLRLLRSQAARPFGNITVIRRAFHRL